MKPVSKTRVGLFIARLVMGLFQHQIDISSDIGNYHLRLVGIASRSSLLNKFKGWLSDKVGFCCSDQAPGRSGKAGQRVFLETRQQ